MVLYGGVSGPEVRCQGSDGVRHGENEKLNGYVTEVLGNMENQMEMGNDMNKGFIEG